MNIVIVEDEPKIRNGLINIIRKYTNNQVIGSAIDGISGVEMICKLKPEVIITDINMPNMDGLTMIEKIKENGIDTEAILLTGYSEFEYAKRAIKLEVVDYLLKPINVEDIIELLDNISKRIKNKKYELSSPEELIFLTISTNCEERMKYIKILENQLGISNRDTIDMFLIKNITMLDDNKNDLINIINMYLEKSSLTGYKVIKLHYEKTILIFIHNKEKNYNDIKKVFQNEILLNINKIGSNICIYERINDLYKLNNPISEMINFIEYFFDLNMNEIIDKETKDTIHYKSIMYPETFEYLIKNKIRAGNDENIIRVAELFNSQIIESNAYPKQRKEYTVRFLMSALERIRELKQESEVEDLYRYILNNIMKCESKTLLSQEYWKLINNFIKEKENDYSTNNGIIVNAIKFISLNYQKDILLPDVAEVVGITPEYLSKLFTQEIGVNFSSFLGNFRISKAKKLLLNNKIKIYEVSQKVGFNDTKYFNKVFKSVVGVSPSEFRKDNSK